MAWLFLDQPKITPPSELGAACPSEEPADIGVRLELQLRPDVPERRTTIERATRVRDRADNAPPEPDLVDQLELDAGGLERLLVDPDLPARLVERVVDAAADRQSPGLPNRLRLR